MGTAHALLLLEIVQLVCVQLVVAAAPKQVVRLKTAKELLHRLRVRVPVMTGPRGAIVLQGCIRDHGRSRETRQLLSDLPTYIVRDWVDYVRQQGGRRVNE